MTGAAAPAAVAKGGGFPWLTAGLIGSQVLGGLFGRRSARRSMRNRFRDTETGKFLKRVSETGIFDPEYKRNVLAQVGSQAYNQAYRTQAEIRGTLAAAGAGESVAGVRATTSPLTTAGKMVTETARDIETRNALSRFEAEREYAMRSDDISLQRQQTEAAGTQALFQGILGGVTTGILDFRQQRQLREFDKILQDFMGGDTETAMSDFDSFARDLGMSTEELLNLLIQQIGG